MRRELLDILVCPGCRGALEPTGELEEGALGGRAEARAGELRCAGCGREYPLEEGIPDLLPDPAPEVLAEIRGIDEAYQAKAEDPDFLEAMLAQPDFDDPSSPSHWVSVRGNLRQLVRWAEAERERLDEEVWVADLGSGSCYTSAALAGAGFRCVAVDISTNPVAGLRAGSARIEHGAPFFDRVRADIGRLPFSDGALGMAATFASIHHALDLPAALAEIRRVLRPGGALLIVGEPVVGVLKNREHGEHEIEHYEWNEHAYTRGEYLSALRAAGFAVEGVEFPDFVADRLSTARYGGGVANQVLGRLARGIWALPPLRVAVQGPCFPALQHLLGIQMLARTRKPSAA